MIFSYNNSLFSGFGIFQILPSIGIKEMVRSEISTQTPGEFKNYQLKTISAGHLSGTFQPKIGFSLKAKNKTKGKFLCIFKIVKYGE